MTLLFNTEKHTPIQYRKTYEYLSIIVGRRLSFIQYADYIEYKIATRLNILCILGRITIADTNLIHKLFIALIQSIIEYRAPALIIANKTFNA